MHRTTFVFALLAGLTLAFSSASAQSGYTFTATDVPVGSPTVYRVIARDVIGTGTLDFISHSLTPNLANIFGPWLHSVAIADGDGVIPLVTISIPPLGRTEGELTLDAADLDQDGDREIIVSGVPALPGPREVVILRNNGLGSFTQSILWTTAGRTPKIRDFDGDGDLDLGFFQAIFLNDGTGAFPSSITLPAYSVTTDNAAGDFDGDGDMDMAIVSKPSGSGTTESLVMLEQTSGNAFTPGPSVPFPGHYWAKLGASDVVSNGVTDLIVYHRNGNLPAEMAVLTGGANGAWTLVSTIQLFGEYEAEVGLADLNGDGVDDFIVNGAAYGTSDPATQAAQSYASAPTLLTSDGSGGWSGLPGPIFPVAPAGTPSHAYLGPFSPADVNGDGYADLVGIDNYNSTLGRLGAYFLNSGPTVPASVGPFISTSLPTVTLYVGSPSLGVAFDVLTSTGVPVSHVPVAMNVAYSPSIPTGVGSPVISPGNYLVMSTTGGVVLPIGGVASPVTITVTATMPSGQTAVRQVNLVAIPPAVAPVSGDAQSAHPNQVFALPLVIQANSQTSPGVVSGLPIVFSSVGTAPVTFLGPTTVTTDSLGRAQILVRAGAVSGSATVQATINSGASAGLSTTFSLSISGPPLVNLVGGGEQVLTFGQAPAPVTVLVTDGAGLPVTGENVVFTASSTAILAAPVTVPTDALGHATVTLLTPNTGGAFTITATADDGIAVAHAFVRRLLLATTGPAKVATYQHEHAQVSLIFAIDWPLPAPGWVSSAYGQLSTSILNPDSHFYALDGIGVLGAVDGDLFTRPNGSWTRTYVSTVNFGLTLVAQMYGYDPAYLYPAAVFVSNPVTFTF